MIHHRIAAHTAFITIDNPPANTWTPEGLRAFQALVGDLDADRSIYAAVITGAGEKFFSAGADLKSFREKTLARGFIAAFGAAFEALMNARFVTLAAINGYAMGGGLESLRIGLVQEVVPRGKSVEFATAMADRVATLSPRAVEYCKRLVHAARDGVPRKAGLSQERERFIELFDHGDQAEGVKAFLDKRKPEWKND